MVYNVDVLESCGINVDDLTTWEAFAAACATIEASGVDPMHIGGKDTWTIGQFFDWVAPSFYVTDETNSKAADLKGGTFDTAVWAELCQMLYDWTEAGYFNTDVLTADYSSDIEALATGSTAFCFYGNYAISDALAVNPDANLGILPCFRKKSRLQDLNGFCSLFCIRDAIYMHAWINLNARTDNT